MATSPGTGPGEPGQAGSSAARASALEASRRGDFAAAAAHMAEACRLAPERGQLHFQLASLLAHLGRYEASLEPFRHATQRLPGFADAWLLQGRALSRLGRHGEAITSFREAVRLAPGDWKMLETLAEAEFLQGWPADALPQWQRLLDRQPGDVHARLRTGETLSRLGYQDQAVEAYRAGVQLQPASAPLWLALAQAEEDCGDAASARNAYEQALALQPGWAFALAGLVGMLRQRTPDTRLQQAAVLLADPAKGVGDRALLVYAIGKASDAQGEHAAAMAHWHAANAARRRVAGEPDVAAWVRRVDRIIEAYPAPLSRGATPATPHASDDRFVFVVGMPRSGTTLTEQILASHPLAHGCGELPDIAMIARAPGDLRAAAERYVAAATRHAPAAAARLVDKEPLNFLHLGLVATLFPRARVVWCRRDPRDIAVSIYGENFAMDETLATDLGGIGHYIRQQERLMRHWQSVLPLPILESTYEALVTDPETQARRIVEFTGLAWDPACLDFHCSDRAVQSPSRWQVRQPVHARSVGRWRNYEAHLGPLLDVIGTDLTGS